MKSRTLFLSVFFALMLQAALAQSQQLTVDASGGKQTVLKRADLEALSRVKVATGTGSSVEMFEGVALKDVLEKGGVVFGEAMRGKRMASCLVVEATDGYRAVIALPEVDPAFTDKQVVLVFLKDGKPLDDKEGPYRIVIPDEKRKARWVRQVTTLKIVDVQ